MCVCVCVCECVGRGGGGEIVSSLGLWEHNRHMHHPSFPPTPPLPPSLTGKNRLPTFQSKKNKHDDTHSHFSRIFVKFGYLLSYLLTYIQIHTYLTALLVFCFYLFFFFWLMGASGSFKRCVNVTIIKV